MMRSKVGILLFLAGLLAASGWLVLLGLAAPPLAAEPLAPSGIDLTARISIDPPAPGPGQEAVISVVFCNQGGTSMGGGSSFRVKFFIDPVDRPPTSTTPGVNFGVGQLPGLPAGSCAAAVHRAHTFTSVGCDHSIYAWVDWDNQVGEIDESNNLVELPVCVGVECDVDSHEADDVLSASRWITEGNAQAHTFCHATDKRLADVDWVKFTTFTGVTYTLAAGNAALHAQPRITIHSSSATTQVLSAGPSLTWQAPASGVYYARVDNGLDQGGAATSGPLTAYSLTLSSSRGAVDPYEPDDRCALARDIALDGSVQTRVFQAPDDQDWVKFAIRAGETFSLIADNAAPGAVPVLTLFNACDQVAANNSLGLNMARLQRSAATDQIYYARITNQDPSRFGPELRYDLSVIVSDCTPDGLEEDDNFGQARLLTADGTPQTHNTCPARDEDWVRFQLQAHKIYVLQTENLGTAADTELTLYDANRNPIAFNDDYGYTKASRIIYQPSTTGTYYAMVRHHDPAAGGPDTHYDLLLQEGFCTPDAQEANSGDNGPGDAPMAAIDGTPTDYNFCADPLSPTLGDQDWLRFDAVPGGVYTIQTTALGLNSDTVLQLYDSNGFAVLASNDDAGPGRSAAIVYTATLPGTLYVRVTQYNTNVVGAQTDYQLAVFGDIPPPPTPTPSPTPSPTPTPVPTATPEPSSIKTLILVHRTAFEAEYGAAETALLMEKLFTLADHERVQGAVIPVEGDFSVFSAYAEWTADQSTLNDNQKANLVTDALRNLIMAFLDNGPNVRYVVLVGDDRMIPFRRVPEGTLSQQEQKYAGDVTANSTIAAALNANMVLTDDYFVDRVPSQWRGNELYLPDYAISRLVETPQEIANFIDHFLADPLIEVGTVLVTGYDFVQDSASIVGDLFQNDGLTTDRTLISAVWPGNALRDRQLNASPRFDIQSINGHSTHISTGTPDNNDIAASEIVAAPAALEGSLVFSVGCHAGLNDPGMLDLVQAFMQRGVHYVGNTGYGWGGGGIVYSEALMRNFALELLRNQRAEIGPSLATAKQRYFSRAFTFNAYDAKILMQSTFYGLPMAEVTSGGTLSEEDPFPSVEGGFEPPNAFGELNEGALSYGLPGSFGAFGNNDAGAQGRFLDLDENITFSAGEPVQPRYYADVSAPAAGSLRGVLFLGGVYTDVHSFDPVVARPHNEYVTDTAEPTFSAAGWTPRLPFTVQGSATLSVTADTVVMSLGQFNSDSGIERVYDRMSFGTLYSNSADNSPAEITFVDGVLDLQSGQGVVKVEARDDSGVVKVVVAYTGSGNQWLSRELAFDPVTAKWSGSVTGTVSTRYFVQVVDGAGNVSVADNKGQYYPLLPPLPLAQGRPVSNAGNIYLPMARTR